VEWDKDHFEIAKNGDKTEVRFTQVGSRCWFTSKPEVTVVNRWDEKAGLRRDAIRSQVIDALEAQEIKETGNEED
jgi:hypothetical protein